LWVGTVRVLSRFGSAAKTLEKKKESTMISQLILFLALSIPSAPKAPACETYAPRLDGTVVTVCDGSVSKVCDASGSCNDRPFSAR
jgi:hypothetical protein